MAATSAWTTLQGAIETGSFTFSNLTSILMSGSIALSGFSRAIESLTTAFSALSSLAALGIMAAVVAAIAAIAILIDEFVETNS